MLFVIFYRCVRKSIATCCTPFRKNAKTINLDKQENEQLEYEINHHYIICAFGDILIKCSNNCREAKN